MRIPPGWASIGRAASRRRCGSSRGAGRWFCSGDRERSPRSSKRRCSAESGRMRRTSSAICPPTSRPIHISPAKRSVSSMRAWCCPRAGGRHAGAGARRRSWFSRASGRSFPTGSTSSSPRAISATRSRSTSTSWFSRRETGSPSPRWSASASSACSTSSSPSAVPTGRCRRSATPTAVGSCPSSAERPMTAGVFSRRPPHGFVARITHGRREEWRPRHCGCWGRRRPRPSMRWRRGRRRRRHHGCSPTAGTR